MRNPVGIYYAFWEQEWTADYIRYIRKAEELGFDVLELAAGALTDMTPAQRADVAKAARDADVELTYCIGLPPEHDMASQDEGVRRSAVEYVKRLIGCVGEMGGGVLGGILYGCWPAVMTRPMTDKSAWWGRSVESVRAIAPTARSQGVTCCMEVVNRFEQFILNTAAEGRRFVDDVGSPSVKLLLDAFHMNIEEDRIGDALRQSAGYIGHFHIGEANRKVPGRGHMPWDDVMDGLRDAGYAGRIVMEPFIRMGGTVGRDIKVWRDLSDNGDEAYMDREAAFALSFIREKLSERG